MNLTLQRRASLAHCTIGELLIDGELEMFTLEDLIRERPGEPVNEWKVAGSTAIPAGRYRVTITLSVRFGRDMPLLNDVPGFSGVRIHPGNTDKDTEGCILVGTQVAGEAIVESRRAFAALFEELQAALQGGADVWIDVRNAA